MTGRAGRHEFRSLGVQRADGASLACWYSVVLTVVPAHFVLQGIAVSPAACLGLGLGLLVACAHLTNSLGMAKGRNLVRSALLLYVLMVIFNFGYASRLSLPPDELKNMDHKLIVMAGVLSITVLVCDGVRTRERLELVLKSVVVTSAFVSLVGILQSRAHLDYTQLFNAVPGMRFKSDSGTFIGSRGDVSRASGTTGTPIELGVLCAMAMPLALHFLLRERDRGGSTRRWWLCVILIFTALFLSVSRSAMVGMGAAGAVLLLGWPARRRVACLSAALIGMVLIRLTVPKVMGAILGLFTNFSADTSVQWRTHDYPIAASRIAEHPWLGRGNWTMYAPKHEVFDNQYLVTLVEAGVIGLVVLAWLLVSGVVAAIRARRKSDDPELQDLGLCLAASLVVPIVGAATFDLLSFATAAGVTFLLLGAAGCLLRLVGDASQALSVGHKGGPPLLPAGPSAGQNPSLSGAEFHRQPDGVRS